ncbi:hypothetical protein AB4156_17905 [Cupriavidus sp. 2MCAB6]|uniref:hypothetical protein n=1 Tax=Cupriavidus sp. 2MCAB6 TaxID=3232981 RepID=UPI003F8DF49E
MRHTYDVDKARRQQGRFAVLEHPGGGQRAAGVAGAGPALPYSVSSLPGRASSIPGAGRLFFTPACRHRVRPA